MSLLRCVILVALCGAASAASGVDAREERKTHEQMVRAAVDVHVLPRLGKLREATAALSREIGSYCSEPDAARRRSVEAGFKSTVVAWGGLEFVRFGPIAEAHRLERFFFWPDPRGVTERQLRAILAKRDAAVVEPEALVRQSVAVQGMGALEIILYDDKHPLDAGGDDAKLRCAYAAAIAYNLDKIAGEVEAGWAGENGWREKMLAPGPGNPIYRDGGEAVREVVKALLMGLQIAKDRHVLPRLDAALAHPPRRVRVAFQRSGLSAAFLEAEVASLSALSDALGLAAFAPPEKKWITSFVRQNFKQCIAAAAMVAVPEAGMPLDAGKMTALRRLKFSLGGIQQVIGRVLAPAAGIVIGFNELDGD